MKFSSQLIGILVAQSLVGLAYAQETSFSVSAGATWSDNITRVTVNEQSEFMPEAGLNLTIARQGRLDAELSVNAIYRTYADDTFDDELQGGLDGSLSYDFVPDRFRWTLEDNLGQSFIDAQAIETPDNRQNLNYFSTGPTVLFPLGSRTLLSISGRWSDVDYEESDFDSQRVSGVLGLRRTMSDTSSLSISVSSLRVEFDRSPPNSDYDLHSAYISYQAKGSKTDLSVRGGITSLHDLGETSDGPLVDIRLTRSLGPHSSLTLNAGTQFQDSADSFRLEREFLEIPLANQNVVPSRDPYQQDYAIFTWSLQGSRTTVQLSADWRNDDHETATTLNRDRKAVNANLSRRLGPRVTASLFGGHSSEDFDVSGVNFDEWSAGVGLNWNLSTAVAVLLRGEHFDGSGDTSLGLGTRDYQENRFTLRFIYSPGR